MKLLKNLGVDVVQNLAMSLIFAVSIIAFPAWADPKPADVTRPKPFELWPATNDAAPSTFTKNAPEFQKKGKPWKFPKGAKVSIKVDASKVTHAITPYQMGCNIDWWDGKDWALDPDRIEKVKESGIRFWRFPGGSSSDSYFWDGKYGKHLKESSGGDATRMTGTGMILTDDFIDFCRKTGSEAIITANYGAARYDSPQAAADLAARWVKYFDDKKFKVRYWEVGNECHGPWEEGNKITGKPQLTGDVYGKDARVITAAMKKADPDIYVGVDSVDLDDGGDWTGFHWWMRDLLPQLKGQIDYLILHQYFMWPFNGDTYSDPKNEVLFGNLHKVADAKDSAAGMVFKYAPAEMDIPVALTEFNLVNASPPQSIQLINGLFTAEVLGEAVKAGYVAVNHWDLKNGLDAKLKGDMALLASGDPNVPDNTPRPSYYSFALCTRAFGDHLVAADSSDPQVKVYASKFAGGELGLVIVNEDPKPRTLTLDLSGFTSQGKLMGWVLTGKDLNAYQVSWNGVDGPKGGGGPFPIDSIPIYNLKFNGKKPLQLNVPAASATGVILY
jgi:hypothetical protein